MTDQDINLITRLRFELAGARQSALDAAARYTADLEAGARALAEANALIAELEVGRDRDTRELASLGMRLALAETLVEQLRCGDLVLFAAGELAPDRAEAFREHLGRCAECQVGLVANADLDARLSEMAATRTPR